MASPLIIAVLVFFFCTGSAKASKRIDSSKSPIKKLAFILLCLSIFGLVLQWISPLLNLIYQNLARLISPLIAGGLLTAIFFSWPASYAGSLFPIMNHIFIRPDKRIVSQTSLSFAIKILGAAFGVFVAGFVLMRLLGFNATGYIASITGVLLSLAAFRLNTIWPEYRMGCSDDEADILLGITTCRPPLSEEARSSVLFAAVFCASFALTANELLWTKISSVIFDGGPAWSSYSMLTAWLAAMGAGAFVMSRLAKRFTFHFGSCAVLMLLSGFLISISICFSPFLSSLMDTTGGGADNITVFSVLTAVFSPSLIGVVPGAFLLGMIIPLSVGMQIKLHKSPAEESSLIYSIAFFGVCLGSIAAGWFIPRHFGLKMGVEVASFMVLAAGMLLILFSGMKRYQRAIAFAMVMVGVYLLISFIRDERNSWEHPIYDACPELARSMVLKEARNENSCFSAIMWDRLANERVLFLDTQRTSSSKRDVRPRRMAAFLSVMACPDPKNALVLGYGTGVTPGALSIYPGLNEVVVVEPSTGLLQIGKSYFFGVNRGAGFKGDEAENVRIEAGEWGRDYLNCSDEKFDLIIIEPFALDTIHNYTSEFYELCKDRLNPGGVICQSVPMDASPRSEFHPKIETFVDSMPGVMFFLVENTLLLFGFHTSDWKLEPERIEAVLNTVNVDKDMAASGYTSSQSFLVGLIGDQDTFGGLDDESTILCDDLPRLDYAVPEKEPESRFQSLSANLAFILKSDFSPAGRILFPDLKNANYESDRIKQYEKSARLFIKGIQMEAKAQLSRLESKEPDFSIEWKPYIEKAFNLNPYHKLIAEKYSYLLVDETIFEISKGNFQQGRALLDKAQALAPQRTLAFNALGLLAVAASDALSLDSAIEVLTWVDPYSPILFSFEAEAAGIRGDKKNEKIYRERVIAAGGLSPREKVLMGKAIEARNKLIGQRNLVSPEEVIELLCKGPDGKLALGVKAWSTFSSIDRKLLDEARKTLLKLLDRKGEKRVEAIKGLSYFKDDEVRAALREIFNESEGPGKAAAMEALARSGDYLMVIKILKDNKAATNLVIEAAKIAADLRIINAAEPLVELLENNEFKIRRGAFLALFMITRLHFNYDPQIDPNLQEKSIEDWKYWIVELRSGEWGDK